MSSDQQFPNIWLRSFFGFSPEEDGYIGWSKEANRQHVMDKIAPGDLMMIYGAGSGSTNPGDKLRILGFLQIEPTPIRDVDKATAKGLKRKHDNGWSDKWTYAMPVRRAWRVNTPARLDQIAFRTYQPEKGRAIAAWSPAMEPYEIEKAMSLNVTEVPVHGEPDLIVGLLNAPLREAFGNSERTFQPADFPASYAKFQDLVTQKSGEPFTRFDEGLIAAWESYKPRVRDYALQLLAADQWTEDQIGSGEILEKVISAIEIQATHGDRTNNMVFWQNRFGHAQRDHRALLDAERDSQDKQRFERLFFDLYRSDRDEGEIFEGLRDLSDGKYPLLAYLFFLKDMDRFMPVQPTGFDRVFSELGIELKTLRNCSWENYQTFNAVLNELRGDIEQQAGLKDVRLIDAHSFCWLFSTLLKQAVNGELESGGKINDRVLGAREKSIHDIRSSVNKTVFNSNGQVVPRKVKEKELRMSDAELEKRIRELLEIQGDRCAITGLPFQFQGAHEDANMLPSLDRIDSNGHYEATNVQLVCRFINFWKQAADDEEFRRLIMIVRGEILPG